MARTVLVVDDDEVARSIVGRWLRESGYDVAFCFDAASAVGAVRRERPDAIVLDLGLPAGGGLAVLERLRALSPLAHIPVVVLTAEERDETRAAALAAGAAAFVGKSSGREELLRALRSAVPD